MGLFWHWLYVRLSVCLCVCLSALPRFAVGLHLICGGDVVGPDVVLPLPESEHPTQDPPRVDPHAHVQLDVGGLNHGAEIN